MSRKKNVGAYYKKQEEARKKAAAKKRTKLFIMISAIVLIVATLGSILTVTIVNRIEQKLKEEQLAIEAERLKKAYDDPVKVALEVKDYGTITLEVYPNLAPKSVEAFLGYVRSGFYDGLTFHRVIEGFMIQGGDPQNTGKKNQLGKPIMGEFTENGFKNPLEFDRGVIGMARTDNPNSATSQFFICHKNTPSLDGKYASFGKVIDGMDVVDAIAICEKTDTRDTSGNYYVPAQTVIITKAYVV